MTVRKEKTLKLKRPTQAIEEVFRRICAEGIRRETLAAVAGSRQGGLVARKEKTLQFKPPTQAVKEAFRTVCAEEINREVLTAVAGSMIILEPSPEVEQAEWLLQAELQGRFFALSAVFGINPTLPGADCKLALRLALEFVPGFNFLRLERRGTPKRVMREHKGLVEAIDKIRIESKQTVGGACRTLVKRTGSWKRKRASDVEAAYYRLLQQQRNRKGVGETIARRLRLRGGADS